MFSSHRIPVTDGTQAGEVRRRIFALCNQMGADEEFRGKASLIGTELAKNLVLHTREGGEIVLRRLCIPAGEGWGLEILSLDKGPGMNVAECLRDGFSTVGTAGTGLGAIRRQCTLFEINSSPEGGTAIACQLWPGLPPGTPPPTVPFTTGAVSIPLAGEVECGDSWASQANGVFRLMVADGLGHGPDAAHASREAVRIFRENAGRPLLEIMEGAHAALKTTRGAAAAIAEVQAGTGALQYVGIGNISARILHPDGRVDNLVSSNGTLGASLRKITPYPYGWAPGALLIMHSDGLATHWDVGRYAGLVARHPGLIAGVLYRDHHRPKDDCTVVVARQERGVES